MKVNPFHYIYQGVKLPKFLPKGGGRTLPGTLQMLGGMSNWLRETMLAEGKISASDLDLFMVTDDPIVVRDHIVSCLQGEINRLDHEAASLAAIRDAMGIER